ncbi:MAG: hypothetical protein DLM72_07130 [Candidatus Nitrosopolaris wilkensis]|nr:MAG: hypothetical protein DLM72_07130 [Candidatus Nitrosopolaris wilkensis]
MLSITQFRLNRLLDSAVLSYPHIKGEKLTVFVNLYANTDFIPSSSRETREILAIMLAFVVEEITRIVARKTYSAEGLQKLCNAKDRNREVIRTEI